MKIFREEPGKNSFTISGLTLGKLNLIKRLIISASENSDSAIVEDLKCFLNQYDLKNTNTYDGDVKSNS